MRRAQDAPDLMEGAVDEVDLEQFNRLVVSLYNGPREEAPWQEFLHLLQQQLQARLTVITLGRPRPNHVGLSFIGGMHFDQSSRLRYANDFSDLDPFVGLPDGQAVTLDDMVSMAELRQSLFYQRNLAPLDSGQVLGVDIYRGATVGIGLRATRAEDAPRFAAAEKRIFNLLSPHLRQMLDWLDRDRRREWERTLYDNMAHRLEVGIVLLDGDLRIVHCNPVARHLLDGADGLLESRGRLLAKEGSGNRQLQRALRACRDQDGGRPALTEALSLPRREGEGSFNLVIKPLAAAGSGASPHGLQVDDDSAPRVAVYISIPEVLTSARQGLLQQLFGFTSSEARLTIALANGLSLEQIAEDFCVTRNTIRTHLRGAFQKAGVRQQSTLVSLVLRSIAGLD